MWQIIQDYNNWRHISDVVKSDEMGLEKFKEKIMDNCDDGTWLQNINKERIFNVSCPPADTFQDIMNMVQHVHLNLDFVTKQAQKYRASSCFYKYGDEERQCINLSGNLSVSNVRCAGCPLFLSMAKYQHLNYRLQKHKQDQENARQKLLNHFRFGKTK